MNTPTTDQWIEAAFKIRNVLEYAEYCFTSKDVTEEQFCDLAGIKKPSDNDYYKYHLSVDDIVRILHSGYIASCKFITVEMASHIMEIGFTSGVYISQQDRIVDDKGTVKLTYGMSYGRGV